MNTINTDLTEIDFIPDLRLEEKMKVLGTKSNKTKNMPNLLPNPKNLQSKYVKSLFFGFLVVKFMRKLKNSIIFPIHSQTDKILLMNDLSFFPEIFRKNNFKFNKFLYILVKFFKINNLMKFLTTFVEKIPLVDNFPIFLNLWGLFH